MSRDVGDRYVSGAQIEISEADARQCWGTPRPLFEQIHSEYLFTVDACALPGNAKLPRYWTPHDDGLTQDWSAENVWCNPPYVDIEPWVATAYVTWIAGGRSCLLLPVRTDRRWWHEYAMLAPHVDLFRGRIEHDPAPGVRQSSNREPSCLVVFEHDVGGAQFRSRDNKTGALI